MAERTGRRLSLLKKNKTNLKLKQIWQHMLQSCKLSSSIQKKQHEKLGIRKNIGDCSTNGPVRGNIFVRQGLKTALRITLEDNVAPTLSFCNLHSPKQSLSLNLSWEDGEVGGGSFLVILAQIICDNFKLSFEFLKLYII